MNATEVIGSKDDILYQNLDNFVKDSEQQKIVNELFKYIIGDNLNNFSMKYDDQKCDLCIKLKKEHTIDFIDKSVSIPTEILFNIKINDRIHAIWINCGRSDKEGQAPYYLSEHQNERYQWGSVILENKGKITRCSLNHVLYFDLPLLGPIKVRSCKPTQRFEFQLHEGKVTAVIPLESQKK